MKKCNVCKLDKLESQFNARKRSLDGLCHTCRECAAARNREWRKANPDGFSKWKEKNLDSRNGYMRSWYEANRGHKAKTYKTWASNNLERLAYRNATRQAMKNGATPPWADRDKIREFYSEANRLTKSTGIRHEVDHIHPLKGDNFCGLHCEYNLQILTRAENASKKNKLPREAA